jgi:hypothetical protein|tara:strand:+ start:25249 stop:25614 length:366 start_codon:yes stop_codon:yes gene_type:complete
MLAYSDSLAGFEAVCEVSSDTGFHRFFSALASTKILLAHLMLPEQWISRLANTFFQLPALRDDDPSTVVKSFLSIRSIFGADLFDYPLIIQQLTSSLLTLRTCADNRQSIADALNRRIYDD